MTLERDPFAHREPFALAVLAAAVIVGRVPGGTFSGEDLAEVLRAELLDESSSIEDVRRFIIRRGVEQLVAEQLAPSEASPV